MALVSPLVQWSTVRAAECSLAGLSSGGPSALTVAPYSLNSNESGVGGQLVRRKLCKYGEASTM